MTSIRQLPPAPSRTPGFPVALAAVYLLIGAALTAFLFSRAGELGNGSVIFAAMVIGYFVAVAAGLFTRSISIFGRASR